MKIRMLHQSQAAANSIPKKYSKRRRRRKSITINRTRFLEIPDELGSCARLIAILESASAHENYYMALYKVRTALDSLQGEFGMDESLYRYAGPHHVNNGMAVTLLKRILSRDKQLEDRIKRVQRHATPKPRKKQPSRRKHRQ